MKTMKFYIKPETKVTELQTADGLLMDLSNGNLTTNDNPDTAEGRDEYDFDEEDLW